MITGKAYINAIIKIAALGVGILWFLLQGNNENTDPDIVPREQSESREPEPIESEPSDSLSEIESSARDIFDYKHYATNHHDFQTWIDWLVNKSNLPSPVAAFLFALIVFIGGLLISAAIDFQQAYLRTGPIYIGAFGIFWVFLIIRYASVRFHTSYEELRPCFLVTDDVYKAHIDHWFEKFTDVRGNFFYIGSLVFLASVAVYVAYFQFNWFQDLDLPFLSLRPTLLRNAQWYTPANMWVKSSIIVFYGMFVAMLLGTAIRLIIQNFQFLLSLRHFAVVPLADVIRTRLQSITTVYLIVTLSWFLGVTLFGVVLFRDLDALSIVGLLSLSFLGLLTFSTPQIIYRFLLVRSKQFASRWILAALYSKFEISLIERGDDPLMPSDIGVELANMDDLAGFVEASSHSELWVYNPGDFLLIVVAQLVALASVFAEGFFKGLVR